MFTECYLDFRYIEQPVSEVDCNIYESPSIQLRCTVSVADESSNFTISWFYNGQMIMNGTNTTASVNADMYIIKSSVLTLKRADYQVGKYYCQVNLPVSESNGNIQLEQSNMFILRDVAEYSQSASNCQHLYILFFIPVESCAIHIYSPTSFLSYLEVGLTGKDNSDSLQMPAQELNGLSTWSYTVITFVALLAVVMITLALGLLVLYIHLHHRHRKRSRGE